MLYRLYKETKVYVLALAWQTTLKTAALTQNRMISLALHHRVQSAHDLVLTPQYKVGVVPRAFPTCRSKIGQRAWYNL